MNSSFTISYESGDLKVDVKGALDVKNANDLLDELKSYSDKSIKNIVFYFKELEYISSSGLRVLIYSKQKIGQSAHLYIIEPSDMVSEVLDMTGLSKHLKIQEKFWGFLIR